MLRSRYANGFAASDPKHQTGSAQGNGGRVVNENQEGRLDIRLLGGFDVRAGGTRLQFPTRKTAVMFAFLSLSPGKPLSRESLAERLWGRSAELQARNSLRQALSHLRRLLGPNGTILVADRNTLALNIDPDQVDAIRFEDLATRGSPQALQDAVDIYRGDLLAGFHVDEIGFADWLNAKRRRFHGLALSAARSLAVCHIRSGHFEPAIETAERSLRIDAVQEPVHRILMRLYALTGQPEEALRQYSRCQGVLARELDKDPEAKTRLLAERIRRHEPLETDSSESGTGSLAEAGYHSARNDPSPMMTRDGSPLPADTKTRYSPPCHRPRSPELRQITVLVCELRSTPELPGALEAGVTRTLLRRYRDYCEAVVKRFGGITYDDGDARLHICFGCQGDPEAPERAVRAAIALTAVPLRLDDDIIVELHTGIGLATGEAVVGQLPDAGDRQSATSCTVEGKPARAAERLSRVADLGEVLLTDTTRRLAGEFFSYRTRDLRQPANGMSQAGPVWRVVAQGESDDRFKATRASRGLTPLIGREEEIGILQRCWQRARRGKGQVALLRGDPGIGKSRIARVLHDRLNTSEFRSLNFYCSPDHTGSALYPLVKAIERAAGIRGGDSEAQRKRRLQKLLAGIPDLEKHAVDTLAVLFALTSDRKEAKPGPGPQQGRFALFRAALAALEELSVRGPLFVLIEDLQWIDPTSLDLVADVVERISALPVFLVATARPGFNPSWASRPHVITVALNQLEPDETRSMIAALCPYRPLPARITTAIALRSDGIPLYVEELTRAALHARDTGTSGSEPDSAPFDSTPLPETLRDLLQVRLQDSGPAADVARLGSVLGRRFLYRVLSHMSTLNDQELTEALSHLIWTGLLERHGFGPEAEYVFTHALLRDAAYQAILPEHRRALHEQAAGAYLATAVELAESEPELIAYLFTRAENITRAVEWWRKAGEQALSRFAEREAVTHLQRGIDLLKQMPASRQRDLSELTLQMLLEAPLAAIKGFANPEVENCFQRVHALVDLLEDEEKRFRIVWGQCVTYNVRALHRQALDRAEKLGSIADASRNDTFLLEAGRCQGIVLMHIGRLDEARARFDDVVSRYDPDTHRLHARAYAVDPAAMSLAFGALVAWIQGRATESLDLSNQGLDLLRARPHPFSEAMALAMRAALHQFRGEPDPALQYYKLALELTRGHGFPYYEGVARVLHGWAVAERGDPSEGYAEMLKGLEIYRETGARLRLPWFLTLLGSVSGSAGRLEEGLDHISEALTLTNRTEERIYEPKTLCVKGDLLLRQGGIDAVTAAGRCFQNALAIARRQGASSWVLQASTRLADVKKSP